MILEKFKHDMKILGEIGILTKDCFHCMFTRPFYGGRFLEQMMHLGAGSLSITIVIGAMTGLVMTLQFGYGLSKFGGTLYVPAIVSLSLMRELAPIFTSLLIAGRIGSGISAEIGAMCVTQQIDAIRALGTNPIRVLVVPRVLAALVSLPLLSTLSAFMGFAGGLLIAYTEFDIPSGFYINKILTTIKLSDILGSMFKCAFFGLVISILACYRGFKTNREGTQGVGTAAKWVVVRTSIVILISDFFLSKILILLFN